MKISQILISILFLVFFHRNDGIGQEVYFSFDYALFRDPGGESILEVYYSVPQKLLKYEKTSSGFEAAIKVDVKITSKLDGAEIASNVYRSPSIVRDTADKNSMQNLVGQVNYFLKPGTYSLTIKGSDFANEEKFDLFETDFIAAGNSGGLLEISDIELSSSITKSDNTTSTFYKNTLEVIPIPSGLFGKNMADMQFYLEFYELTAANVGDKYSIRYSVLNTENLKWIRYQAVRLYSALLLLDLTEQSRLNRRKSFTCSQNHQLRWNRISQMASLQANMPLCQLNRLMMSLKKWSTYFQINSLITMKN